MQKVANVAPTNWFLPAACLGSIDVDNYIQLLFFPNACVCLRKGMQIIDDIYELNINAGRKPSLPLAIWLSWFGWTAPSIVEPCFGCAEWFPAETRSHRFGLVCSWIMMDYDGLRSPAGVPANQPC